MSNVSLATAFDVGDRVTARNNFGGFFRASVPRGSAGVVTALHPDGAVRVAFSNDQHLTLDPADVDTADVDTADRPA